MLWFARVFRLLANRRKSQDKPSILTEFAQTITGSKDEINSIGDWEGTDQKVVGSTPAGCTILIKWKFPLLKYFLIGFSYEVAADCRTHHFWDFLRLSPLKRNASLPVISVLVNEGHQNFSTCSMTRSVPVK